MKVVLEVLDSNNKILILLEDIINIFFLFYDILEVLWSIFFVIC